MVCEKNNLFKTLKNKEWFLHFDLSICLLFESPITSLNDLLQQEPDRIKLSIFHFSPFEIELHDIVN